ncbi:MAG: acyl-CoA dehydrogenase, partial [Gammaproteobacteria bacterium]|nr:acyl-CoA dehydrogenase [Gammaproteobacteria bacterium]
FDRARNHADEETRSYHQRRGELLTPLVKGWSTENGVELCSLGIQVHGGMGFIEETGAAQYLRDARITPIYEGTTAILANDLIGRKTARDGGQGMSELLADIEATQQELEKSNQPDLQIIANQLGEAVAAAKEATEWLLQQQDQGQAAASSVEYLMMNGRLVGGWMMGRIAQAANGLLGDADADQEYAQAKITLARYYAEHELPKIPAGRTIIIDGAESTISMPVSQL